MSKRIFIGIAAALLATAALGGVVLAQTEDGGGSTFAARLAAKLGLSEPTVQTAIDEVRAEMKQEKLDALLDAMVESDKLTQEQADEYRAWVESAPDDLPQFRSHRSFGRGKGGHHWFRGGKRCWFRDTEQSSGKTMPEGISS